MKHTANRVLSILLALLLMMSAFGETIAFAEEPAETAGTPEEKPE